VKEMVAVIQLKKYRTLKQRYREEEEEKEEEVMMRKMLEKWEEEEGDVVEGRKQREVKEQKGRQTGA